MARQAGRSDRDYAAWIVGAILLIVLVGFSRSFFLRPVFGSAPHWAAKEPIFYLHGFVFSAWFALLAVQTYLVRARDLRLHRRLGFLGAGLGAGIVLLGSVSGVRAANRAGGFIEAPAPPEQFLIVPLLAMLLFGAFLALAVINRTHAASHKRLIILASVSLLGAPIARMTLIAPVLPVWLDAIVYCGFVAAMAAWDFDTRRRIRPETLFGGGALILLNIAALPIAQSGAWQGLALSLMSLAGPP